MKQFASFHIFFILSIFLYQQTYCEDGSGEKKKEGDSGLVYEA